MRNDVGMRIDENVTPVSFATASRAGIGSYEFNVVTGELSWDATLAAIFEADLPGECPRDTWLRRVHPGLESNEPGPFCELRQDEAAYLALFDDGRVRHVLSRLTHVTTGPDGEQTCVTGVMLDVTELHLNGARLSAMLDSISDGFCALNRQFHYTYVNQPAEILLGMSAPELIGNSMWDVFPQVVGTNFEACYRRVMVERVAEAFEAYYEPLGMWVEVRAQPSVEGMVIYFQNVSERRTQQAEYEQLRLEHAHQASHDSLTGLVNRSEFEQVAAERLAPGATSLSVLFLDLDRFKLVNDTLGHAVGDALLVEMGQRLRRTLRPGDVAARLGGDEFVVLLDGLDMAEAQLFAAQLLDEVRVPVQVGDYTLTTSASIGLAAASIETTVATLLRNADVAMYRAKDAGRDGIAWFDADAHEDLLARVALERDLREAIEDDSIRLHYQPIFDAQDRRLVGVEALARWTHPQHGEVPPSVFVPLAEEVGLIRQLGASLIMDGIKQAARWAHLPDFTVWVNVSGRQLDEPNIAQTILNALAEADVAPSRLGIEITESVLLHESCAAPELRALSEAGVSIAIDDFGTGYSSPARLIALPISILKIDRTFVANIETRGGRAAIDVIMQLARVLKLRTVAEGIETQRQLDLLVEAGADSVSGYFLGLPAPARDLLEKPLLGALPL
ncbi:hypothetical protein BH09ACT10_BH09ACT10_17570 [soil metagenome]